MQNMLRNLLVLSTLVSSQNATTEVAVSQPVDIIIILSNINEGSQLINDMCENLDSRYTLMGGFTKPECYINVSYVNKNDIVVFQIPNEIKTFLQTQKKEYCSTEQIECGEITILLKMLDLINNAVKLSVVANDFDELQMNLKIIDFYDRFITYKYSLNNVDILTNITLHKQKINVILTQEKTRLKQELNKAAYHHVGEFVYFNIGLPIKNMFIYGGSLVGETLGETIENIIPSMSVEGKVIIFLGIIYLLKRC